MLLIAVAKPLKHYFFSSFSCWLQNISVPLHYFPADCVYNLGLGLIVPQNERYKCLRIELKLFSTWNYITIFVHIRMKLWDYAPKIEHHRDVSKYWTIPLTHTDHLKPMNAHEMISFWVATEKNDLKTLFRHKSIPGRSTRWSKRDEDSHKKEEVKISVLFVQRTYITSSGVYQRTQLQRTHAHTDHS